MRLAAALLLVSLPSTLVTRDAYLMGTRVHLAAQAPTREAGLATLDRALRILEATERELTTWRDDSAISALNRHPVGAAWPAPAATCRMLRAVFAWHAETNGAFDPALAARLSSFSFDEQRCEVTRRADAALDVGGFGKGEALDRVAAALGAGPWLVDLGGQVSVGGPQADGTPWVVDIAHPADRARPYRQVTLQEGSLSTSGNSERGDHIVDPRTGRPPAFRGSVTVWHAGGLAADALSTALYVMGPDAGTRWAETRGIAALYLIPEAGRVRALPTRAFSARE
jgi:FAD:protein FMN transferase